MSTWLLVADGFRGRLFLVDKKADVLVEIMDYLNPQGRLSEKELASDSPGRTFDSKGQGRHVIQENKVKKEQAKEQFAHKLAKYLNDKQKEKQFNRLIIVAPSKFMGYINKKINCDCTITKIVKDMTSLSSTEIFDSLRDDLLAHKII